MASATFLIVTVLALAIYFIPTIVASGQRHPNDVGILILNLFLGWTLIGWVVALVWAVSKPRNSPSSLRSRSRELPAEANQARRPCPFCAEMILDAAVICRFCGRNLPENWARPKADPPSRQISSNPSAVTITCPECSRSVLRGTRTCPDCGTRIPFFA